MKLVHSFLVTLLGLSVGYVVADVFKQHDRDRLLSYLPSSGSLAEIHYSTESKALLEKSLDTRQICSSLKEATFTDIYDLYHASAAASMADCPFEVTNQVKEIIRSSLAKDVLVELFYATETAFELATRGKLSLGEFDFNDIPGKLTKLIQDDGLTSGKVGSKKTSRQGTGLLLQMVSNLHEQLPALRATIDPLISSVTAKIGALMDSARVGDDFMFVDRVGSILSSTAAVLKGLVKLHNVADDKLKIDKEDLDSMADFFLKSKHVSTAKDSYFLLSSLKTLADNPFHIPLRLEMINEVPILVGNGASEGTGIMKVQLTNVMGEFVTNAKVSLRKAQMGPRKDRVVVNKNLEFIPATNSKENSVYLANFVSNISTDNLGVYQCGFAVERSPNTKNESELRFQISVKVSAVLESVGFQIFSYPIAEGKSSVSADKKLKVNYPSVIPKEFTLDVSHSVNIALRLKSDIVPLEVLFVLRNKKSGKSNVLLPTKVGEKYELKLRLNSKLLETMAGGDYALIAIVGDQNLASGIHWDVASLIVDVGQDPDLGSASRDAFGPKRGVPHVSRPGLSTAPNFVDDLCFSGCLSFLGSSCWNWIPRRFQDFYPWVVRPATDVVGVHILYAFACRLGWCLLVRSQYLRGRPRPCIS
eukprot:406050_1